jgi:hypothetical protein
VYVSARGPTAARQYRVHVPGGAMQTSIYRSLRGEAEILWLYDEALSHLRISHESKMGATRYG